MLHRTKVGIGIAVAGIGLALVPSLGASAAIDKATKGSNPDSSLCKIIKSNAGASAKSTAAGNQAVKYVESGNWTAAKKAYLSSFASEGAVDKAMTSAVSRAPSSVRTAVVVLVAYQGTVKGIVQKSSSIATFESATNAAAKNPKFVSAESALSKYITGQCGSSATS